MCLGAVYVVPNYAFVTVPCIAVVHNFCSCVFFFFLFPVEGRYRNRKCEKVIYYGTSLCSNFKVCMRYSVVCSSKALQTDSSYLMG